MTHIKGYRFGLPAVQRLGLIDDAETHRIRWNAHAGLEIHYVLRGRFTWEIRRRRNPLVVPGGYFVILPAEREHRAAGETGTPSHRLGVILEPFSKSIARGTSLSADELRDVFGTMSAHALELRPITPEILKCIREMRTSINDFALEKPDTAIRLRILSELLLVETKIALEADSPMPHGSRLMENIRRWIDEHLTEDISSDRLVAMSGYSRSRFFTLFRTEIGLTPADYIVRGRIALAAKLLQEHPDMPASAVARKTGFSSPSFFTLNFRKHTGTTPSAFRKLRHERS